jgi:hypothetical protein
LDFIRSAVHGDAEELSWWWWVNEGEDATVPRDRVCISHAGLPPPSLARSEAERHESQRPECGTAQHVLVLVRFTCTLDVMSFLLPGGDAVVNGGALGFLGRS